MDKPRALELAGLLAFAFLSGSIPFGLIFTGSSGVDIRQVGSGNIGATNVLRSVGKKAALLTLLGDILKGTAPVAAAVVLGMDALAQGTVGLAAIIGHNYSVFLGFKGGKGVATSIGVSLMLVPWAGLLTVVTWLAVLYAFRYSSLAAILSFLCMPGFVYIMGYGWEKFVFSVIISILLVYRHQANIRNLIKGTERRVGERSS